MKIQEPTNRVTFKKLYYSFLIMSIQNCFKPEYNLHAHWMNVRFLQTCQFHCFVFFDWSSASRGASVCAYKAGEVRGAATEALQIF